MRPYGWILGEYGILIKCDRVIVFVRLIAYHYSIAAILPLFVLLVLIHELSYPHRQNV
jgi:hypothetical protein